MASVNTNDDGEEEEWDDEASALIYAQVFEEGGTAKAFQLLAKEHDENLVASALDTLINFAFDENRLVPWRETFELFIGPWKEYW